MSYGSSLDLALCTILAIGLLLDPKQFVVVLKQKWITFLALVALLYIFCVLLLYDLPSLSPGKAFVCLAIAAGIMSLQPDMHGGLKLCWILILAFFGFMEFRSIDLDRVQHERQFQGIANGIIRGFQQDTRQFSDASQLSNRILDAVVHPPKGATPEQIVATLQKISRQEEPSNLEVYRQARRIQARITEVWRLYLQADIIAETPHPAATPELVHLNSVSARADLRVHLVNDNLQLVNEANDIHAELLNRLKLADDNWNSDPLSVLRPKSAEELEKLAEKLIPP